MNSGSVILFYQRLINALSRLCEGDSVCFHRRAQQTAIVARLPGADGKPEAKVLSEGTLKDVTKEIKLVLVMRFSSIFGFRKNNRELPIAPGKPAVQLPVAHDSSRQDQPKTGAIGTNREPTGAMGGEIIFPARTWCLPTQADWVQDPHPLRIWEKSVRSEQPKQILWIRC